MALVVSVSLATGVFASADPTEVVTDTTGTEVAATDTVVASWSAKDITAIRTANKVAVVNVTVGIDDKGNEINFGPFARANFDKITGADYYVEFAVTGDFSGVEQTALAYAGTLFSNTLAAVPAGGISCTKTDTTVTFSSKGITLAKKDGVTVTADAPNVGVNVSGFISAGTSATDFTFAIYKRAGTTEPSTIESSATESTPTAIVTGPNGEKVLAQWQKSTAKLAGEYIYVLPTDKSDAGVSFDTFWANDLIPNLAANRYVDIEFNGNFTGASSATAQIKCRMFAGTSSMRPLTSVSENKLLLRVDGAAAKGSKAQIDLQIPNIDGDAFRFDNLTVTLYEKSGSDVTSGSGATSGGGTKPTGTPGALKKNVLWDGDVTATVTISNYRGALNNVNIDTAIRQDIASNGTIVGNEYYEIITTGYMQGKSGYAVAGFATGDYEFWANGKAAGCAVVGTSAGTTTQKCAAGDTDKKGNLLADKMNASKTQFVYFSEADGYTDTVHVSHITINVYRQSDEPLPTEPSVSESKTSASESKTSASESATSASESAASASESASVTDPSASETGFEDAVLGDANGDGAVNMKDVLVLRKYLAGIQAEINLVAADANGDGDVNMKDVLALRKFLAGLTESLGA